VLLGDTAAALGDALRHGDAGHVPAELNTVRLAARMRTVADDAVQQSVDRARGSGHTWQEIGEHTIVNVPMEFQGRPMTGRVVFDADGRIAGFSCCGRGSETSSTTSASIRRGPSACSAAAARSCWRRRAPCT
jgi:hypothetical protein